jgi:transposase
MRPYSNDLRERVAAAVDHHEGSLRQIARRFRIGVSTLVRWLVRRNQTGSLDPKPHGGGGLGPSMRHTPRSSATWCGSSPTPRSTS